ncbi:head-tail connector protein [Rhizobium sp. AG855]|uniref:head-tail connector protein n=1 Tax=Rhizobium sp. AG855 TaxID=2183898 RepID=UPI000E742F0B|nr:head-tail connector protein [Rhizobium sp. AG855]RKE85517.1 putative phiE125 gp8 family phage protein [Rhizobium sp. AG855]
MTIIDLTPPLAEPLTLAEVKVHLRLDTDDEDTLLVALIAVAREHLERETGLVLAVRDFRLCLDAWPDDGILTIARGPVRQVTDVTVYDGDGVGQAVDLDGHLLDGEARPARLWLRDVPQPGRVLNGIEVEFVAGFGESGAEVPDTLKRAMLLHIAAMFACRGVVAPEAQPAVVPPGYDRLIAPFCRRGL